MEKIYHNKVDSQVSAPSASIDLSADADLPAGLPG
jgi:hypothetical protein